MEGYEFASGSSASPSNKYVINVDVGGKQLQFTGDTPKEALTQLAAYLSKMARQGARFIVLDTQGEPLTPDEVERRLTEAGNVQIILARRAEAG